jgi:hypothetical protein
VDTGVQGGNKRLFSLRRHYPDQVSGSVAQTQVMPPSQPGLPKLPVYFQWNHSTMRATLLKERAPLYCGYRHYIACGIACGIARGIAHGS